MQEQIYLDFVNKYQDSDMVLIGIGDELSTYMKKKEYAELLQFYIPYLEKKNYFCITSSTEKEFFWGELNTKRIVQPALCEARDDEQEEKSTIEKQWDFYNKWLSATLNKKLMLVELGEGFKVPNLIRWPFERVAFINQKSSMFRINGKFPQISENIAERAVSVEENPYVFLQELRSFLLQH